MFTRMVISVFMACSLLASMGQPVSASHTNQSDQPPLFTDAGEELAAQATPVYALRSRVVFAHTDALVGVVSQMQSSNTESAEFVIPLFEDATFTARFDSMESTLSGGYILSGVLVDIPESSIILAVEGEAMSASMSTPDGQYVVQPEVGGIHRIFLASPEFGQGEDDQVYPPQAELGAAALPPDVVITGEDTGSQIDLLVVYTDDARAQAGGTSQIKSLINTAVADTNLAYNNSQVVQDMLLVKTEEVNFDEGFFNTSTPWEQWSKVLNRLTDPSDGYLDSIPILRNTVAADLVVFVVNNSAYCGLAWVLSPVGTYFEHYAYAMVSRTCLGSFTLAHETGHNLGGHHNREAAGTNTGAFSYSYGYHDPSCKFYTVMSYSMTSCPGTNRIPYYSNPNVYYSGVPTGIVYTAPNSADMRMTLNNTALLAANFRDGPPRPIDLMAALTIDHSGVDLSWTDIAVYESGYEVERKINAAADWSRVASLPANATAFHDYQGNGLACEETYDYRVRAQSAQDGFSNYSDLVSVSYNCLPPSPTNLTVQPQSLTSVLLNWQDNSGTEEGFDIFRSLDGVNWSPTPLVSVGTDITSYLDTSVNCGTSYSYRVTAYNTYGTSPQPSEVVMANTPICPPSAPAGISAKSTSQIRANLTWSPGDMGLCPVDGLWVACKPVNGYHVERRQGTGTWSEIVHLPSKSLSFSDDGLVCNTTYSYRIRAQNSSGFSDYSSEVGVTSQACAKPPKPGWMRLTKLGFRGQLLTWQEVDGETSYVMQRSSDGKRWRDWVTLSRDTNSLLVNPNMLRPPKYYYRVRAVNAYGASAHTPIGSNFSYK